MKFKFNIPFLTTKLIIIYFVLLAFDGLIRGLTTQLHVSPLGYAKDGILFSLFIVGLVSFLYKCRTNVLFLFLSGIVVCSFAYGMVFYKISLLQASFAAKLISPVIISLLLFKSFNLERIQKWLFRISIVIVCGVLLNHYVHFPWQDATFSVGGIAISAVETKNFMSSDISRSPGFGSSGGASAHLMIVSWFLFSVIQIMFNRKLSWRYGLYTVFIVFGILATTSKTSLMSFAIIALAIFFYCQFRRNGKFYYRYAFNAIAMLTFVLCTVPLIISSVLYYKYNFKGITIWKFLGNQLADTLFGSFFGRTFNTWPRLFRQLFPSPETLFLGKGLGVVGAASVRCSADSFYADGFAVLLLGQFGIAITLVIFILLFRNIFLSRKFSSINQIHVKLLCVLICAFGCTQDVIDTPELLILIGPIIYFNLSLFQRKNQSQFTNQALVKPA